MDTGLGLTTSLAAPFFITTHAPLRIEWITLREHKQLNKYYDLLVAAQKLQRDIFCNGGRTVENYENMLIINGLPSIQGDPKGLEKAPKSYEICVSYFKQDGKFNVLGASMYLIIGKSEANKHRHEYDATVAGDYTYVIRGARKLRDVDGQKIASGLWQRRDHSASEFTRRYGRQSLLTPNYATFIENENPWLLTLAEHRETFEAMDIYPIERMIKFLDGGFRIVGARHVEAESIDGAPRCTHYALLVKTGNSLTAIPTRTVEYHSTGFSSYSRKWGGNPYLDADHAATMEEMRRQGDWVTLNDWRPELHKLNKIVQPLLDDEDYEIKHPERADWKTWQHAVPSAGSYPEARAHFRWNMV